MTASIACKRGEANETKRNPIIAIQYAPKRRARAGPEEREEVVASRRALDPQFAEPAHVHPPCPIAHPFTLRVRTQANTPDGVIGGAAKSSTGDHDLPAPRRCRPAALRSLFVSRLGGGPETGGGDGDGDGEDIGLREAVSDSAGVSASSASASTSASASASPSPLSPSTSTSTSASISASTSRGTAESPLSRAACALRRSYSSQIPQRTRMTHQTNVSESGGTRIRARINPMVTMVTPGVMPISNLGEGYQRVLVTVPPREQRWTKTQTAVVPWSSAADAKAASAPIRERDPIVVGTS